MLSTFVERGVVMEPENEVVVDIEMRCPNCWLESPGKRGIVD